MSWQEYFIFSRSERRGILLLSFIMLVVILVRLSLIFFVTPITIGDLHDTSARPVNSSAMIAHANCPTYTSETVPEVFDPNVLNDEQWIALGLTRAQVRTIRNYQGRGGMFRKKEDVKKLYCIDAHFYSRIENRMVFPSETMERKEKPLTLIEINTADSADFERLRGIGPVLAARIIRYRNALGGFISAHQLLEVYGLNDSVFHELENYFLVDTSQVLPLQINKADYYGLSKHPYINAYQARAILRYRELNGAIPSPDALIRNKLFSAEAMEKIRPYLQFQQ